MTSEKVINQMNREAMDILVATNYSSVLTPVVVFAIMFFKISTISTFTQFEINPFLSHKHFFENFSVHGAYAKHQGIRG